MAIRNEEIQPGHIQPPRKREPAGAKAAISVGAGVLVALLYLRGVDLALSATVVGFLGWVFTAVTDYLNQEPTPFEGRNWGRAFYHALRWLVLGGIVCMVIISSFGLTLLILRPEEITARQVIMAGGSSAALVLAAMTILAWKRLMIRYAESRFGMFVYGLRSITNLVFENGPGLPKLAIEKAVKYLLRTLELDPYSHLFNRIAAVFGVREALHIRLFRPDPTTGTFRVEASAYSPWLPVATRDLLKRHDEGLQLSMSSHESLQKPGIGGVVTWIADNREMLTSELGVDVLLPVPVDDSRVRQVGRIGAFVGCPVEIDKNDVAVLFVSSNIRLKFSPSRSEVCLGFAEVLRHIMIQSPSNSY